MIVSSIERKNDLHRLGAEHHPSVLCHAELGLLADLALEQEPIGPGRRLIRNAKLSKILVRDGSLDALARTIMGRNARPVRAVLFDKQPEHNWSLGWHQDRTIAVREKIAVPGFGPWSVKAGIHHVEPPFSIISRMITLRAHLDPCPDTNAPLMVSPGTHKVGRIAVDQVHRVVGQYGTLLCEAAAGDVWVYATSIVHSSGAAQKPKRRRVLQVDFTTDALPGELEWLGI